MLLDMVHQISILEIHLWPTIVVSFLDPVMINNFVKKLNLNSIQTQTLFDVNAIGVGGCDGGNNLNKFFVSFRF